MIHRFRLAPVLLLLLAPLRAAEFDLGPQPLTPAQTPGAAVTAPAPPAALSPLPAAAPLAAGMEPAAAVLPSASPRAANASAAQPALARLGASLAAATGQTPAARADAAKASLDAGFDHSAFHPQGDATCGHCGFAVHDAAPAPFVIPARLDDKLPSRQNETDWTKETSLHSHSYFSDGTMSPEAVVQRAYDQGVRKMALSDHDSVAGVQAAWRKAKALGMEFHPSAELTARGGVHVGAVDMDIFNPKLTALLARVRAARYKHAQAMADFLNGPEVEKNLEDLAGRWTARPGAPGGYRGDTENLAQKALDALRAFRARGGRVTLEQIVAESHYAEGGTIEMPHVSRALLANGLIENVDDAFDTFFKTMPTFPDVPPDPTYQEVLEVVHAAGGKAFLNHPYTVRGRTPEESDRKAYDMLGQGFDGVEAYRPSNATSKAGRQRFDERVAKYLTWAEEYRLLVGNGADYHGEDTHLNHIVVWMPKDYEATLLQALAPSNAAALASLERAEPTPPSVARALPAALPLIAGFSPAGAAAGSLAFGLRLALCLLVLLVVGAFLARAAVAELTALLRR